MGGVRRKVAFLVMALPHSDALFVQAFPRECTETFWEGHVRAFEFFGLVPRRIAYDNTKVAVAQILGPRARRLTRGFQQLVSHYLFGIAPPLSRGSRLRTANTLAKGLAVRQAAGVRQRQARRAQASA